jgi:hypothetical protein
MSQFNIKRTHFSGITSAILNCDLNSYFVLVNQRLFNLTSFVDSSKTVFQLPELLYVLRSAGYENKGSNLETSLCSSWMDLCNMFG